MIKASVVGATGFTGAVLTGILQQHPEVELSALTSVSYVGQRVEDLFPYLRVSGVYVPYGQDSVGDSDVIFVCYPHGEAFPVVAECAGQGQKVIDLSADFRLREIAAYREWYGFDHPHQDLVGEAAYGLPELYRDEIRLARVVANPGCYPTSVILAVAPLAGLLGDGPVIVDSKSGVSGAGRGATGKTHFCSVQENFRAYSEVGHRHTIEMVQEISVLAGRAVPVSFTPHLLPVDRGILSTVYLRLESVSAGSAGPSTAELTGVYRDFYRGERFVEVVDAAPALSEVQGTNYCRLAVRADPAAGLVKVVSVIDNMVKGASGQAVQNMNVVFGFPENLGLEARA